MPYTERQVRAGRTYRYRVRSVRKGGKVTKRRVYLGADLPARELRRREREADAELGVLDALLSPKQEREFEAAHKRLRQQPAATRQNRYEAFVAQFTFDSNAIEGNTLTLDETSQLLFEGLVPARSLREVNEALNHKRAFDRLLAHRGDITKRFICDLHALVVQDTLAKGVAGQAGRYRDVQVFIRGVDWVPAAPKDVPKDMKALLEWYTKNKRRLHPVVTASYFHVAFELVHPFVDGNGRVGRLLMNFILRKHGYPMVNIPSRTKRAYYVALHAGQVDGDLRPFIALIQGIYRSSRLLL